MILVLCCAFAINLTLGLLKNILDNRGNKADGVTVSFQLLLLAVSFGTGIVVSFINFALGRIVRWITLFEGHDTYTDYNLSVAI